MFIRKISKELALKPLQIVIGIVEKKQTLPILSNVLIENGFGKIRFTATDLEIQITTTITIDNSEQENENVKYITVAGKKLQEILRILPESSEITLEEKDQKILIKSNKSKFSLQTLPYQDFPKLNTETVFAQKISLKQTIFKDLLLSIQYAMAQQDVRYYLNGVLLVLEGNLLKAVATDGHRLAFNQIEISGNLEKHEIILPRKAITELCKLLGNNDDLVEIQFSDQQIKIDFSEITLISKIIDGKFPDYERVIPKHTNHLSINRLQIQQALQRVAILSNEKFRGVRFVLTEQKLTIISSNSEQEEAQEEIDIDYHGEALDIGFNVNYLMDGLNNIIAESAIFSFGDQNSSVLISTDQDFAFKYVVMPMRI
jgi:DNA polymerase-3 subunit beta